AVHLENVLREVIRDDDLAASLRPAVYAIARHNLADSDFRVGPPSGTGDARANEPLTFLLVLCDEVQEWGRVRVDPLRYREELATKTQFGGENSFAALSSSFALFPVEIGIGKMRPTVHNLVNSITSSQKHGGRKWNLPQRS
ncbi:MAG: hypothetical protein KKG47_17345, partial [Proteobacteria bacterium]|nr:hypothetical protein [Pseudomonadota bacterium]